MSSEEVATELFRVIFADNANVLFPFSYLNQVIVGVGFPLASQNN